MKKLDLSKVPSSLKKNPIFNGFPDTLKNVRSFNRIEKKLADIVKSDHKHTTVSQYVKCLECNKKYVERKEELKRNGFTSYNQYLEWKKIMTIIKDKKSFQLR